jgi:pimeloyl-ACP methyl ester carboxylesterase
MSDWTLTRAHEFQGQTVRYDVRGDGPALVLVHGTPWSSFNWRYLVPHLAEKWTVYFYDLLGYGQSEMRDGQDVSLGVQNRVLAHLLEHWQLNAPRIVGHDFGGTTVLRAHLVDGLDFERIVLCNPVALSPWGSPFFAHVNEHETAFQGVPEYIHEAIVIAYVKEAMHKPMPKQTLEGILRPWLGDVGRKAFYRQIAQADRRYTDEVEPLYAEISRPVLIAWGEEDTWIPLERGRRLHEAIPGSRFVPISQAGHLVQEDQPNVLLEAITKFFA